MFVRRSGIVAALATASALCLIAPGCAPSAPSMGAMPDGNRIQKQSELMQKLASEPDLPPWYAQRERLAQAMGDRVFDKDFDRVFDSVTVALATLGANVNNMERQSGYITSAVPALNPQRERQLQMQGAREYCKFHKYDPSLLERSEEHTSELQSLAYLVCRLLLEKKKKQKTTLNK